MECVCFRDLNHPIQGASGTIDVCAAFLILHRARRVSNSTVDTTPRLYHSSRTAAIPDTSFGTISAGTNLGEAIVVMVRSSLGTSSSRKRKHGTRETRSCSASENRKLVPLQTHVQASDATAMQKYVTPHTCLKFEASGTLPLKNSWLQAGARRRLEGLAASCRHD